MRAHLELYKSVVFARASLPRIQRERIAVVVSATNRCPYCVGHHSEALRQLGDDPAILEALCEGQMPDGLALKDRRLLEWVRRATVEPSGATEEEIADLRELGWDDRAVLDAALTASYFNFVNRLVLLLGVDLEAGYERLCGDEPTDSRSENRA